VDKSEGRSRMKHQKGSGGERKGWGMGGEDL